MGNSSSLPNSSAELQISPTFVSLSEHLTASGEINPNAFTSRLPSCGRIFATFPCSSTNDNGLPVILKVHMRDSSYPFLSRHVEDLKQLNQFLSKMSIPFVVPTQLHLINDKTVVLIRQYFPYTLYDRMVTAPILTEVEKRWIYYQLLMCFSQLHQNGIRHGDIKPGNIMLTSQLTLYVTDFALHKPSLMSFHLPHQYDDFFNTKSDSGCYVAPERLVITNIEENDLAIHRPVPLPPDDILQHPLYRSLCHFSTEHKIFHPYTLIGGSLPIVSALTMNNHHLFPDEVVATTTSGPAAEPTTTTHNDSQRQLTSNSNVSNGNSDSDHDASSVTLVNTSDPDQLCTGAMDIFSLGCVIAFIASNGRHLFTYQQLLAYKARLPGSFPDLSFIADFPTRVFVAHMISLDDSKRLSCTGYMYLLTHHKYLLSSYQIMLQLITGLSTKPGYEVADARVGVIQRMLPNLLNTMIPLEEHSVLTRAHQHARLNGHVGVANESDRGDHPVNDDRTQQKNEDEIRYREMKLTELCTPPQLRMVNYLQHPHHLLTSQNTPGTLPLDTGTDTGHSAHDESGIVPVPNQPSVKPPPSNPSAEQSQSPSVPHPQADILPCCLSHFQYTCGMTQSDVSASRSSSHRSSCNHHQQQKQQGQSNGSQMPPPPPPPPPPPHPHAIPTSSSVTILLHYVLCLSHHVTPATIPCMMALIRSLLPYTSTWVKIHRILPYLISLIQRNLVQFDVNALSLLQPANTELFPFIHQSVASTSSSSQQQPPLSPSSGGGGAAGHDSDTGFTPTATTHLQSQFTLFSDPATIPQATPPSLLLVADNSLVSHPVLVGDGKSHPSSSSLQQESDSNHNSSGGAVDREISSLVQTIASNYQRDRRIHDNNTYPRKENLAKVVPGVEQLYTSTHQHDENASLPLSSSYPEITNGTVGAVPLTIPTAPPGSDNQADHFTQTNDTYPIPAHDGTYPSGEPGTGNLSPQQTKTDLLEQYTQLMEQINKIDRSLTSTPPSGRPHVVEYTPLSQLGYEHMITGPLYDGKSHISPMNVAPGTPFGEKPTTISSTIASAFFRLQPLSIEPRFSAANLHELLVLTQHVIFSIPSVEYVDAMALVVLCEPLFRCISDSQLLLTRLPKTIVAFILLVARYLIRLFDMAYNTDVERLRNRSKSSHHRAKITATSPDDVFHQGHRGSLDGPPQTSSTSESSPRKPFFTSINMDTHEYYGSSYPDCEAYGGGDGEQECAKYVTHLDCGYPHTTLHGSDDKHDDDGDDDSDIDSDSGDGDFDNHYAHQKYSSLSLLLHNERETRLHSIRQTILQIILALLTTHKHVPAIQQLLSQYLPVISQIITVTQLTNQILPYLLAQVATTASPQAKSSIFANFHFFGVSTHPIIFSQFLLPYLEQTLSDAHPLVVLSSLFSLHLFARAASLDPAVLLPTISKSVLLLLSPYTIIRKVFLDILVLLTTRVGPGVAYPYLSSLNALQWRKKPHFMENDSSSGMPSLPNECEQPLPLLIIDHDTLPSLLIPPFTPTALQLLIGGKLPPLAFFDPTAPVLTSTTTIHNNPYHQLHSMLQAYSQALHVSARSAVKTKYQERTSQLHFSTQVSLLSQQQECVHMLSYGDVRHVAGVYPLLKHLFSGDGGAPASSVPPSYPGLISANPGGGVYGGAQTRGGNQYSQPQGKTPGRRGGQSNQSNIQDNRLTQLQPYQQDGHLTPLQQSSTTISSNDMSSSRSMTSPPGVTAISPEKQQLILDKIQWYHKQLQLQPTFNASSQIITSLDEHHDYINVATNERFYNDGNSTQGTTKGANSAGNATGNTTSRNSKQPQPSITPPASFNERYTAESTTNSPPSSPSASSVASTPLSLHISIPSQIQSALNQYSDIIPFHMLPYLFFSKIYGVDLNPFNQELYTKNRQTTNSGQVALDMLRDLGVGLGGGSTTASSGPASSGAPTAGNSGPVTTPGGIPTTISAGQNNLSHHTNQAHGQRSPVQGGGGGQPPSSTLSSRDHDGQWRQPGALTTQLQTYTSAVSHIDPRTKLPGQIDIDTLSRVYENIITPMRPNSLKLFRVLAHRLLLLLPYLSRLHHAASTDPIALNENSTINTNSGVGGRGNIRPYTAPPRISLVLYNALTTSIHRALVGKAGALHPSAHTVTSATDALNHGGKTSSTQETENNAYGTSTPAKQDATSRNATTIAIPSSPPVVFTPGSSPQLYLSRLFASQPFVPRLQTSFINLKYPYKYPSSLALLTPPAYTARPYIIPFAHVYPVTIPPQTSSSQPESSGSRTAKGSTEQQQQQQQRSRPQPQTPAQPVPRVVTSIQPAASESTDCPRAIFIQQPPAGHSASGTPSSITGNQSSSQSSTAAAVAAAYGNTTSSAAGPTGASRIAAPWYPSGLHLSTLTGHTDRITDMAVNDDHTVLATTSIDGSLRLFSTSHLSNIPYHPPMTAIEVDRNPLHAVTFLNQQPNLLAVGSHSPIHGSCYIYDLNTTTSSSSSSSTSSALAASATSPSVDISSQISSGSMLTKINVQGCIKNIQHMDNVSQSLLLISTHLGATYGWDLRCSKPAFHFRQPYACGELTAACSGPSSVAYYTGTRLGYVNLFDLRFSSQTQLWRHPAATCITNLASVNAPSILPLTRQGHFLHSAHSPLLFTSVEHSNQIDAFDVWSGQCRIILGAATNDHVSSSSSSANSFGAAALLTPLSTTTAPTPTSSQASAGFSSGAQYGMDSSSVVRPSQYHPYVAQSYSHLYERNGYNNLSLFYTAPFAPGKASYSGIGYPHSLQDCSPLLASSSSSGALFSNNIMDTNPPSPSIADLPFDKLLSTINPLATISRQHQQATTADGGSSSGKPKAGPPPQAGYPSLPVSMSSMAISPSNNSIITAGRDNVVRFWNLRKPTMSYQITNQRHFFHHRFSPAISYPNLDGGKGMVAGGGSSTSTSAATSSSFVTNPSGTGHGAGGWQHYVGDGCPNESYKYTASSVHIRIEDDTNENRLLSHHSMWVCQEHYASKQSGIEDSGGGGTMINPSTLNAQIHQQHSGTSNMRSSSSSTQNSNSAPTISHMSIIEQPQKVIALAAGKEVQIWS